MAFGLPPHRYLLTRRIERAKALLRDTDSPVIDVAFETGWGSLGTFGRIFRDIANESPTQYRARAKLVPHMLEHVPHCFVSAAHRPDLTIAVSEKRRRSAAGTEATEERRPL
jgi:AraC-like DNA-binding protein